MNPVSKKSIFVFLLLGSVLLGRQAYLISDFHAMKNPLRLPLDDLFASQPLVDMDGNFVCSTHHCDARFWENRTGRLAPVLSNFEQPSSGWRQDEPGVGRYLRFDGINDRVVIPHVSLSTETGFQALAWVRFRELTKLKSQIFDSRSGNWNTPLRMTQRGDRFFCESEFPSGPTHHRVPVNGYAIEKDKWVHLGCGYNPKSHFFYAWVNGKVVGAVRVLAKEEVSSERLSLGTSITSEFDEHFKGDISSIKILAYPADSQEIGTEYKSSLTRYLPAQSPVKGIKNAKTPRSGSSKG
jgi:hypothetical protein